MPGQHIAFQPQGPAVELEADYVVVGSGAGGATAAVTLARGGASVIIVEAGPWRDPDDYPSSVYGGMRDLMEDWGSMLARGRAFWPIVQARLVGGTTVINSAICVRTPADIFRNWQREFGIDGDAMAEAVWRHQETIETELCVEEVPVAARGRSNELAMVGANKLSFDSHVMKRYVKGCTGSGQCMQGCKQLRKQSTNLNYVPEVIERGGSVVSCAPVKRVLMEGLRAVGVTGHFVHPQGQARGATFVVRAKKAVLVAASVTHTAPILERSGLRHAALGQGFRAHPGTPVFGVYDEPVDMFSGATQGWASTAFREEPGFKLETLSLPLDLVAGRLSGGGRILMDRLSEYRHMAMWVQACRAEAVGVVRNGFMDKPSISYTATPADMHRFRTAMHLIAKMHFAAGARAVVPAIFGLPYKLGPNEVDQIKDAPLDPQAYVAILSHLFGGAMMGTNPLRSVVDERGRVHGYQGLLVVDASVIPTNLGVNPQHTIMGLARLFAEHQLAA